jgi:hypothetical protein
MPLFLYRGVPRNTARGRAALQGSVHPRGTSTDYLTHVQGGMASTDVTSWTYDEQVARRFGDLILVVDADDVRGQIVDPHPLPSRYPYEKEVLLKGVVRNVKIL